MDEGTFALDEETEAKVLQAVRPLPQNKIVITVALAADEVLVIQDGEASLAEQPLEKMPTV